MEDKTNFNNQRKTYITLAIIPILFFLLSFITNTPKEIIQGLYKIIIAPDILLTDYFAVGGLGATFLNVALVAFACIYIVYIFDMEITGPLIAAIITVIGFSFMGKNIVNIWPIIIGGYLYSRYEKVAFQSVLTAVLFATTLAPAVSEIAFGLDLSHAISIPLAIIVGLLIGFTIVPLAKHMALFHSGYNLYNIGFTGGVVGTLIASILLSFGLVIETQSVLSTEYHDFTRNLMIFVFALYIVLGYIINDKSFKGYSKVLKTSGRNFTSFIEDFGIGLASINIGMMGLVGTLYVILVKGTFNGPVVAGIFTAAAFAPFGKHPKNSIPILMGVYIATLFNVFEVSSTSIVIAALFGTTLAPIAGVHGFIPGIIAGFLHVSVVSNAIKIHNGLNLYNNGFTGGIVAALMAPILNAFFTKKKE